VHAFRGKPHVEYDNPYDVGMTGLIGFGSGYRAMEHCDALVMLGTDSPYRPFFPEGVPVVQVDVRGERIGRRAPVEVPLVGTVQDTVPALLPLLTARRDAAHLHRMTAHYGRARRRVDHLAEAGRGSAPIHPQVVAATVDRLAADDAVFTLSGDGGLAMLLGELITLHQERLPVKVIVFNNGALSFVELEMKAAGVVTYGTDLQNPDFAGIARAAGLFGTQVTKAGDLEPELREAFEHDGPALVDVHTARHELALPPRISYGELTGFTLYATRTVLSGGGEELIDLARTNLRDVEIE
jgi:pyruvate dehydrogenase (quinone)